MTGQKNRILQSSEFIRAKSPFKTKVDLAVITYLNPSFMKDFKSVKKLSYSEIPPLFDGPADINKGEFIFASSGKKNFYHVNGHFDFFAGYKMRDAAHPVYVLKELGVKNILIVDEVGFLNSRFEAGGVSFIYDHINFMGDNPLIGENDSTLGPRFPDMSNAYDTRLYAKIEKLLVEKKFRYFPSVYIGVTGPETETEAECRFYREIGSDVLGYSLIPENLAAVHASMSVAAFGMISRELVADRLKEITSEEKSKNRRIAEKHFAGVVKDIVGLM